MARVVRRFGMLGLGVVAIVAGVLVYQFRPTASSFGWTAYAPLSNTAFVPPVPFSASVIGAALLTLLGAILIAGWVGFVAGQRRSRRP